MIPQIPALNRPLLPHRACPAVNALLITLLAQETRQRRHDSVSDVQNVWQKSKLVHLVDSSNTQTALYKRRIFSPLPGRVSIKKPGLPFSFTSTKASKKRAVPFADNMTSCKAWPSTCKHELKSCISLIRRSSIPSCLLSSLAHAYPCSHGV